MQINVVFTLSTFNSVNWLFWQKSVAKINPEASIDTNLLPDTFTADNFGYTDKSYDPSNRLFIAVNVVKPGASVGKDSSVIWLSETTNFHKEGD